MSCATVGIQSNQDGSTLVTVVGRANFDSAVPLRDFVRRLGAEFAPIEIELGRCIGMDSTFMGVLSMLGLKAHKSGTRICILNAGDTNRGLLSGLGVARLFQFEERNGGAAAAGADSAGAAAMTERAETVLEAHRSLMEADESNVARFGKVVELTEDDLKRLKK